MKKTAQIYLLVNTLLILLAGCQKDDSPVQYGSVTDLDGNTYKTVVIGSQTWMAANLRKLDLHIGLIQTLAQPMNLSLQAYLAGKEIIADPLNI
jgi:hypothetical protein